MQPAFLSIWEKLLKKWRYLQKTYFDLSNDLVRYNRRDIKFSPNTYENS